VILHILKRGEWDEAKRAGCYAPPSLVSEGFIHCSTEHQVAKTANLFFPGQRDLVLLVIDEGRLHSDLKHEAPASMGHERTDGLFPHLYGPLNLDAVTAVHEFPCDGDGRFALPAALLPK
jgi:uncharacterized protein (DUF952 family)